MWLSHSKSNNCRIASRTRISENIGAPRVEHQAVHALGQSVGEVLLDDAAVAHRRKVVGGLPAARVGFDAQVVEAFLERLEMRVAVAVIVVSGSCRNSTGRG